MGQGVRTEERMEEKKERDKEGGKEEEFTNEYPWDCFEI